MHRGLIFRDVTLFFLIVFAFRLPFVYNSTILAFLYLFISFIFVKSNPVLLMKSRPFILQCFIYGFLLALIFLIGSLHGTYDYSKANVLSSQLFSLITILLFVSKLIKQQSEDYLSEYIFKIISYVFLIQCSIILFSFFNNEFRIFISQFQANTQTEGTSREGVRALALAGGQYFTLSSLFVICNIVLSYYLSVYKKVPLYFFLIIQIFLALTASTAGRIYFLSLPFAFVVFIYYSATYNRANVMSSIKNLLFIFFFCFSVFLLSRFFKVEKLDVYIGFVFEFVLNYLEYGSFETESTYILSNMYFGLDSDVFVFGTGMYSNDDGTYYMHTDAGFMRNILYYGVLGLLVNYLIFAFKLLTIKRKSKVLFSVVIFVVLSCLHIKGEAITHIIGVEVVLWTLFFLSVKERLDREISNY